MSELEYGFRAGNACIVVSDRAEAEAKIAESSGTTCTLIAIVDPSSLDALREAWIDVPSPGITENGNAEWMQNLINAVTAIVDPNLTLIETDEVKRRTLLASYRGRFAYWSDQARMAAGERPSSQIADIAAELHDIAAKCRAEFGVELTSEIPRSTPTQESQP